MIQLLLKHPDIILDIADPHIQRAFLDAINTNYLETAWTLMQYDIGIIDCILNEDERDNYLKLFLAACTKPT